jgi:hypothetical protein
VPMTIFVISHKDQPYFKLPEGAILVWLNPKRPPLAAQRNVILGYDFFQNPEVLHKQLSGTLGAVVIHKHLMQMSVKPELITIWQYRKFVIRGTFGTEAKNFPGMRMVHPKNAAIMDVENPEKKLLAKDTIPPSQKLLVCPPLHIRNMSAQYRDFSHVIDLFRFTSIALELGVVTPKEVLRFFNMDHLVTGGLELGTYPTNWWLGSFEVMMRAVLGFSRRHGAFEPEDPYHGRAAAFVAERLGSYFVFRHLSSLYKNDIPLEKFGNLHNVGETNEYTPGI